MINLILLGFGAVIMLSYWLSGRVAARRNSAMLGAFTGVFTLLLLMCAYLAVLYQIARSWLMEFLQSRLPQLIDTLIMLLDRFMPIRETL